MDTNTTTRTEPTPVTNVVGVGSSYIGDGDSSYFAVTFDPATERFDSEGYGYGNYPGDYGSSRPLVEVTPEVKARAIEVGAALSGRARREEHLDRIAERAHEVERGRIVTVNAPSARNRPKTGTGRVFWIGPDRFSRYGGTKIGVELEDGGKGFYHPSEVRVADPTDYIDYAEVRRADEVEATERERFTRQPYFVGALRAQSARDRREREAVAA